MGVNVTLEKLDGTKHPDWDDARYSGDRELVTIMAENGGILQHPAPDDFNPWIDDTMHFRPADFDALARAPWPDFNQERWAQFQRILRDEPDYWVYVSV